MREMKCKPFALGLMVVVVVIMVACGGNSFVGDLQGDTTPPSSATSDGTNNVSTGTGKQNTLPPKPSAGEFWYARMSGEHSVIGFSLVFVGDTTIKTPNITNVRLYINGNEQKIDFSSRPPIFYEGDNITRYFFDFDLEYIDSATYWVELDIDGVRFTSLSMELGGTSAPLTPDISPAFAFATAGDGIVFRITTPNLQDILSSDVGGSWSIFFELDGEQWFANVSNIDGIILCRVGPSNTGREDWEVRSAMFTEQDDMYIVFSAHGDISDITMITYPVVSGGSQDITFNKSEMHMPLSQIIKPADPNEHGNTSGNINNGSFAVLKGNTVYYANDNGGISKANTDGTSSMQLTSNAGAPFQVVGDWIYISGNAPSGNYGHLRNGIHRIRTDGTNLMTVYDIQDDSGGLHQFIVVGDWIYFNEIQPDGNWALYKIRTVGIDKILIDANCTLEKVEGDWVYYKAMYDGLHKIRTDGSERTRLSALPSSALTTKQIHGDWIYYIVVDNNFVYSGLARVRIDGTEDMLITTDRVFDFIVDDDWIYYSNVFDNRALYRIRTDGTGNMKLDDTIIYGRLNIIGDWIYVQKTVMGMANVEPPILHKIRIDGTNLQVVD